MYTSLFLNNLEYKKDEIDELIENEKFLKQLAKDFPTIAKASREIINLQAILNLPKGTEHFLSDVHGEYESFIHVLKNASGVIKRKIDDIFGDTMTTSEKKSLATLIYYPKEKTHLLEDENKATGEWYKKTLYQLIEICRVVASKYTRSKVRKALPEDFAYIIEELLHENNNRLNKEDYYSQIISTIIELDRARAFVIALSELIQRLSVDRLHLVGDIFDRGPGAEIIMQALTEHHSVDIQWGNHDVLWMGAAGGSRACIANVVRISLRYGNTETLEDGYGINMMPLATFAMEFYPEENNPKFSPKLQEGHSHSDYQVDLIRKMHKAISIIQFKLEGQIIRNRPHFGMEDRNLMHNMDLEKGTINVNGTEYLLNDTYFPTLDLNDPYTLTQEENNVITKLQSSFMDSGKLQYHTRFLYSKGGMYLKYNSNLLLHGCIPMEEDGSFTEVTADGVVFKGKSLVDRMDRLAREAYYSTRYSKEKDYGLDIIWYLWCGPKSPLFGKDKMATLERYFIEDKTPHKETKNPYFDLRDKAEVIDKIFKDFDLDPETSHIINGHLPVKVRKGESPIKADGKLIVIDGGFSKAYQPTTGIAGYTFIYNSYGMILISHEPFESTKAAIENEKDILSSKMLLETAHDRIRIKDTDIGKHLKTQVDDLKMLLKAYKVGFIKEQTSISRW